MSATGTIAVDYDHASALMSKLNSAIDALQDYRTSGGGQMAHQFGSDGRFNTGGDVQALQQAHLHGVQARVNLVDGLDSTLRFAQETVYRIAKMMQNAGHTEDDVMDTVNKYASEFDAPATPPAGTAQTATTPATTTTTSAAPVSMTSMPA